MLHRLVRRILFFSFYVCALEGGGKSGFSPKEMVWQMLAFVAGLSRVDSDFCCTFARRGGNESWPACE